jgi:hypothetical protein
MLNTGFNEYSATAKERAHLKIYASLTVTYSINGFSGIALQCGALPLAAKYCM